MCSVHESRMSCRSLHYPGHGNSLMRGEGDMYVKLAFLKFEFHPFHLIREVKA
jgi:hypothetical protein